MHVLYATVVSMLDKESDVELCLHDNLLYIAKTFPDVLSACHRVSTCSSVSTWLRLFLSILTRYLLLRQVVYRSRPLVLCLVHLFPIFVCLIEELFRLCTNLWIRRSIVISLVSLQTSCYQICQDVCDTVLSLLHLDFLIAALDVIWSTTLSL
jgi:hypothetical protein